MAELPITEDFLKLPQILAMFIIATFVLAQIFSCIKILSSSLVDDVEVDMVEITIAGIKSVGYGILVWFIYGNIRKNQLEVIDVLTYFTLLLACIETAHNFVNSVGKCLAMSIKGILVFFK